MTNKTNKREILRKVSLVFSWLWLFYVTIKFVLGTADTFSTVCMFLCYSVWALNLILSIILKIVQKVSDYKLYKTYVNGFNYLKAVHKARYKLYFTGNSEEIETYSEEIERYGATMLNVGESLVSNAKLNRKQSQKVSEILEQTRNLMQTTFAAN